MAYKPVGVDQNSRFPTRVETALALLFSRRIRRGIAKSSAGVLQWGIPSVSFMGVATSALNPNEVRYLPFEVRTPIALSALQFEVVSAPATAANVAVGIYAADATHQPTGSPVYDSGSVPVAAGFTGIKTLTGLTATIPAGFYLLAVNTDKALTMRNFTAPSHTIVPALGANAIVIRHTAAQVFGAFPATPTLWTTIESGTIGYSYGVVFQWSETT